MTTRILVAALGAVVLSAPALAQSSGVQKGAWAGPGVPGSPGAQRYDGVMPGSAAKNPLPQAPGGGSYLVWTGFQMTNTGSRVFLQTTQTVPFEVRQGAAKKASQSTLEILLRGCRIHMANNRRKIDTRFFATPVSSISARQKGRDVEVRIAVRRQVDVTPRGEEGPTGTQFLVIDFPPGTAESAPDAARAAPGRTAISDGEKVQDEEGSGSSSPRIGRKRAGPAP